MKFSITHTFKGIGLDAYEKLFFDPAFNQAIKPAAGLKSREELEQREENGIIHRKARVVPEREFPPPLNKLVKGELSYVEYGDFDPKAHRLQWRSELSILNDKIKLFGEVLFRAAGDGVERVVSGECNVSIFGIGGVVEKIIVDNLKDTYAKIAEFTQRQIDQGTLS